MPVNTTENVTHWRQLADQLTPEQIAEIEYYEREQIPPGLISEQNRINAARSMIRHNLCQTMCAGVPTPADSIDDPSPWDEWDGDDGEHYQRVYTAWRHELDDTRVQILGYQNEQNRIYRRIFVDGSLEDLSAGGARAIAAALLAAAERMEQLSDDDASGHPVDSDYYPCCHAIGQHSPDCR